MKQILFFHIIILVLSCSEKKTDVDTVQKGVFLDTIKKDDTIQIVPKVVEPKDFTNADTSKGQLR